MLSRGLDEPGGPESRIGEASYDPARWRLVAEALEASLPGWRGELVYAVLAAAEAEGAVRGLPRHGAAAPAPGTVFSFNAGGSESTSGWALLIRRAFGSEWTLVLRPKGRLHASSASSAEAAARLGSLAPSILRATRICDALHGDGVPEARDVEDAWDRLPHGVLATDARLVPFAMNVCAQQTLESRRLFRPLPAGARLQCARIADDDALQEAAAQILSGAIYRARVTIGTAAHGRLRIELHAVGTGDDRLNPPFRPPTRHPRLILTMG